MKLTPQQFVDASRLIARTAAKYARATGSHALEEDIAAAGWCALLATCHKYDSARGDWEGYVLSIASRAIRRELWVLRSPVSGSPWRASTWAAGLHAAGTEALHAHTDAATLSTPPPAPDAFLIEQEFVEEFLDAVRSSLMDTPGAELALAVLLGEMTPEEVAADYAVSPGRVHVATRNALAHVRSTLAHLAPGASQENHADE